MNKTHKQIKENVSMSDQKTSGFNIVDPMKPIFIVASSLFGLVVISIALGVFGGLRGILLVITYGWIFPAAGLLIATIYSIKLLISGKKSPVLIIITISLSMLFVILIFAVIRMFSGENEHLQQRNQPISTQEINLAQDNVDSESSTVANFTGDGLFTYKIPSELQVINKTSTMESYQTSNREFILSVSTQSSNRSFDDVTQEIETNDIYLDIDQKLTGQYEGHPFILYIDRPTSSPGNEFIVYSYTAYVGNIANANGSNSTNLVINAAFYPLGSENRDQHYTEIIKKIISSLTFTY
ncbi:hypothetical protein HGA91_04055 [candidate division WWE3 bacterium]|nr:hypothetical protein [candidate division WWE3 bacterium]